MPWKDHDQWAKQLCQDQFGEFMKSEILSQCNWLKNAIKKMQLI